MKRSVLGIDVGGTNVKLGIIDPRGCIISRSALNTKSFVRNKNKLIDAILGCSNDLLAGKGLKFSDIDGVGLGLPGLIDSYKGIVAILPNVPGWRNVPLKSILQKKIRRPVFIENDVNLIALGEWKFGAGKNLSDMICITLGTGVGGGLILNNQLYRGAGYAAGEIGHMPISAKGPKCNCGGWACFERYVGNSILETQIRKIFKNKEFRLEDVFNLAKKGNVRALRFWEETGITIGNALTGVVNLLNPTHIIIGGGVSNSHAFLFKSIQKTIRMRAMKVQGRMVKIVKAKLGNDAGIIGAQELVQEGLR